MYPDKKITVDQEQFQATLLTTEQAAELLQISPATLQKWRSTGQENIPYLKIGRLPRYKRSAIEAYITRKSISR